MQKNRWISILTILLLTNLILIINQPNVSSSPIIMIQGYVYVNDETAVPDEVSLEFSDQIIFASVYDYGNYFFIFPTIDPGITGTFEVIFSGVSYIPIETFTVEEEIFDYEIDLHIETSGEGPPVDPTNIQPKADAGGPYYRTENVPVGFDASDSYDIDGYITNYEWDFGDGITATGKSPTNTFQETGTYRIKLTVTDNKGKTDLDITYAYITDPLNKPPSKPITTGPTSGLTGLKYNYTLLSTDEENHTLRYLIDWDDETDSTVSDLLLNGTIYTTNHSWTYAGIYTLRAFAIDEKDYVSKTFEQFVLIDSIFCGVIGHMIDYTGDNIYDLFHSNATGEETPVDLVDDVYLIDDDNDGRYDYQFDILTLNVSTYVEPESDEERSESLMDMLLPLTPYILVGIMVLIILIIVGLAVKIKRKPKKKKVKKEKEKKEKEIKEKETKKEKKKKEKKPPAKEKPVLKPKEEVKRVEDEIDELLSKKKS